MLFVSMLFVEFVVLCEVYVDVEEWMFEGVCVLFDGLWGDCVGVCEMFGLFLGEFDGEIMEMFVDVWVLCVFEGVVGGCVCELVFVSGLMCDDDV